MHKGIDKLVLQETHKNWKEEIRERLIENKPVVLFGAGSTSEHILSMMEQYGFNVVAFCDNDVQKHGKLVAGRIVVIGIEELKENYHDTFIYITTQLYYVQIREQLLKEGFSESQICEYDLIPQFQWENEYDNYLMTHIAEYNEVYNALDDESKKVLEARFRFLLTRKREYAVNSRSQFQYFDLSCVDYEGIRHFFDIGTFTGDSIQQFLDIRNNSSELMVYGFEPDRELYRIACDNTREYNNVRIYPYGLSDYCGGAIFQSSLGKMQTIEMELFAEENVGNDNNLEIRTLDSLFCDSKYENAFLKMDIEGAEMGALKGAKSFILNNRPICAICVYHKEDDIINVWKYLSELIPDYKFYLRHYSDNQTETVLYAV